MKKHLIPIIALAASTVASAQGNNTGLGHESDSLQSSLAQRVLNLESLHNRCNIYLNFNGAATLSNNPTGWDGRFRNKHLRIDIKGNVTDNIYYRFRHRLDKLNQRGAVDRFSRATDIMMVGYRTGKLAIECGKMFQYLGGFEYDSNPIYVYEYSELIDMVECAKTGVALVWNPVASQELVLNVTNSMADNLFNTFPDIEKQGFQESRFPIEAVANWNGTFASGLVDTRCSAGLSSVARGVNALQVILGGRVNLPDFRMYTDYSYERSGLDRMGIASSDFQPIMPDGKKYLENTSYHSIVSRADWQMHPRWSMFGKGAYEWCSVADMPEAGRRHYAAVAGLEFRPVPSQELRYYLCMSHHWRRYSVSTHISDGSDSKVELGIICRLKML